MGSMCIAIVYKPGNDVVNFEIKGALSGLRQSLATESPLKMIKKCFLFHVKSSFRSQHIQVSVLTF